MKIRIWAAAPIVALSLLVAFGGRYAAASECEGLTGDKYRECIQALLESAKRFAKQTEPEPPKPPVVVEEPRVKHFYGKFLADVVEFEYGFDVAENVELDLSRVYREDDRVGEADIGSVEIIREPVKDGRFRVRIVASAQSFSVLCAQNYVALPTPEVFWRKSSAEEWKLVEFFAAKALISPMSLCDEYPNTKEAPKEFLEVSRKTHTRALFSFAALMALAACVALGRGFLEERRRVESSPLYRAAKKLRHSGIALLEAIEAFRTALREKFGIGGADNADEVRASIRSCRSGQYADCAEEGAELWEQTLGILYEDRKADPALVGTIRTFIKKLVRRERDE